VGVKKASLEDAWNRAVAKLHPSAAAMAAAEAAVQAADKEAERARLGPLVEQLANRPDLLDHAASVAQALGVVGERKAIKANYIAMSSRTLGEQRVLSVVITGLSSAGKSHLMNTVARIFPPECIEVITSGSPKSLVFMVRDDPYPLSHKIILLGETAGYIAGSDTESNPSAALVRDVLTEGVITYGISEKGDKNQFVTHRIKVWGPISLITTTARANLDPEMENRLLGVPIDESPKATAAIRHAQLSGETRRRAEGAAPEVEKLIDFQRWLQLEAGVRVVIPDDLLEAIDAAGGIPVTVQTRRDVPLFLLAVKACAVIHIARRQRDAKGQVVAEFEDYEVAHDAVDGFIAAAYSTSLKPPEIAVLAAIESLIDEAQKRRKAEAARAAAAGKTETAEFDGFSVTGMKAQFTYDTLAAQAQIKSRKTLSKRVKALKRAEAIKVTVEHSGFRQKVSTWELLIPAAQAVTAAKYGRLMPDPVNVLELLHDSVTRRKRLDQILAENGTLPDWQHDDAQGDDARSSTRDAAGEDEDEDEDDDGEEAV
jgi:energy-coupling factor transporter ATP-binding protein EcfA2